MKKLFIIILFATLLFVPLFAEFNLTTEVSLNHNILLTEDTDPLYFESGNVLINLDSVGFKNVKTDMGVNLTFNSNSPNPSFSLDHLTIKARFPSFRLTFGKTRLDWGEGNLFNAGNVLFNSTSYSVPLLNDSVILEREWLGAVTIPLSSFSFLEGAIILPDDGDVMGLKGGIRYYSSEGSVKIDTGISAGGGNITPHLSIMGNIGIDASISTSFGLPVNSEALPVFKESWNITGTLFHIFSFMSQDTLSVRIEILYAPYASGEELPLFLYPSLQYGFSNGISLYAQSIVSPIDLSASISLGGSWNIFEGLTINSFMQTAIGDDDDVFTYGNVAFSIGLISLF